MACDTSIDSQSLVVLPNSNVSKHICHNNIVSSYFFNGFAQVTIFYANFCFLVLYSTLLHLPPLDFTLLEDVGYESWARIFKRLRSPGIDSKESILPAYVAGTTNRVIVPARKATYTYI